VASNLFVSRAWQVWVFVILIMKDFSAGEKRGPTDKLTVGWHAYSGPSKFVSLYQVCFYYCYSV